MKIDRSKKNTINSVVRSANRFAACEKNVFRLFFPLYISEIENRTCENIADNPWVVDVKWLTCFSFSKRNRCNSGNPAPMGLGDFSFDVLIDPVEVAAADIDVSWWSSAGSLECISSERTRGMRRSTPFGVLFVVAWWSGCNSIDSLLLRPVALWVLFCVCVCECCGVWCELWWLHLLVIHFSIENCTLDI